ncbi:MAG: diadenylate cyclase CdaA [Clostridiales bacterium]|nr:diadenylate cyclase CdaA [Clostridiales bacterium]
MSFFQNEFPIKWSALTIITTIVDVLLVAYVIYQLLMLIRGTRAMQLVKGILVLLLVYIISGFLQLNTIRWMLNAVWSVILIALAVIFQPELRRALEQLGRGQFFSNIKNSLTSADMLHMVDELIGAVISCAKTKTGLLVVLERETGLSDYVETGVKIDAVVSEEFLSNVFSPNTPLHDGAAIIKGDRVMAAACFLPLSDNPYISTSLGTRHRAAIGISEVSDAVAIVVSEENGVISVAKGGKLVRYLEEKQLRGMLLQDLSHDQKPSQRFWQGWPKKGKSKK